MSGATITFPIPVNRDVAALNVADDAQRRGLELPVRPGSDGRSRTLVSDAQDRKIIFTALSANWNANAFQQEPGLGGDMVYANNAEDIQGRILVRVRQVFDDFERQHRYRLVEDSVNWEADLESDSANQNMTLSFRYFNIESDKLEEFSQAITGPNL